MTENTPDKIYDHNEVKDISTTPIDSVGTVTQDPLTKKSRFNLFQGGWPSTFIFLVFFFVVSFSLGRAVEQNGQFLKLLQQNGVNTGANGQGAASGSKFSVSGFKQIAKDLKLNTSQFDACLDTGKYASAVKKDLDEGVALGVQGTPTFVINGVAIVGAQPFDNFKPLFGGPVPSPTGDVSPAGLQDGEKTTKTIAAEEGRTKGDKNAPITIYEFSDFECPFCEKFYSGAYKQIVDEYIKPGKAKIVFKDFPLSIHAQAQKAAEAGRCAQEQNKFWEMHDKLFELQLQ